ncbi:ABC transporter ATP-binding protein [Anaerosporobacter faecicola]|uniref:ABC transporter ATP-binding protein n=1 Tax=Anaerosporobacter faecicola TaxID=2718714 RepID=UPI002ED0DAD7
MENVITTKDLTKVYGDMEVVSHVNMHVKQGTIYGFLGPNGAGKTTTMKMIMNLTKPICGSIHIFGKEVSNQNYENLKRMSAIIETPIFYEKLTALENLQLHCAYMGYHVKEEITRAMQLVELTGCNDKKVRQFSLGMKQRLAIARAILTKPEILILDEPINGLDPEGIQLVRSLLKKLSREQRTTIVVSSHILSEIEQIADDIGIMCHGKLIKEMGIKELQAQTSNYLEIISVLLEMRRYAFMRKRFQRVILPRYWFGKMLRLRELFNTTLP